MKNLTSLETVTTTLTGIRSELTRAIDSCNNDYAKQALIGRWEGIQTALSLINALTIDDKRKVA